MKITFHKNSVRFWRWGVYKSPMHPELTYVYFAFFLAIVEK